jgi:hypothetical protein
MSIAIRMSLEIDPASSGGLDIHSDLRHDNSSWERLGRGKPLTLALIASTK